MLKYWIQAARVPSNVNLIFPLLVGQAFAFGATGNFSWPIFILVMLYGWFNQLYIVFWNDVADYAVDPNNTSFNMFSGGSRVLPEKKIAPRVLFSAGFACACLVVLMGWLLTLFFGLRYSIPLFVIGLFLLWMYSFPPIKLNYRGGGEVLQGLGCGVLLPTVGFYVQAGHFNGLPLWLIMVLFIFHFSSSVATALPDTPADRLAIKRTLPVLIGVKNAATVILILMANALLLTYVAVEVKSFWVLLLSVLAPALCIVLCAFKLKKLDETAASIQEFDALVILSGVLYALGFCIHLFSGGAL